jgi:RNA polymerase sigma-70 factor (ECF subfamily)
MPAHDESALVARLRANDHEAFAQLFRDNVIPMTAVARRFFGDTTDANEAVQDALVSAFKGMAAFEGTAKLGTWLHRITVNACLLKMRGRKRSRLVPLEDETHVAAPWSYEDGPSQSETCAQVRAGVERLSTEETAARLGTNCGAVKTRLHRARQALKAVLEPQLASAV